MARLSTTRTSTLRPSCKEPLALSPELGEAERAYCYAIAMKYVKNEDAAADVAQEAMLLAHRHRHAFRGASRYSTWLYRVASTTALMYLRKQKRQRREIQEPVLQDGELGVIERHSDPRATPEDCVANGEAIKIVTRRLDQLGDKYKPIFWMRYFEGYTETEIARMLDLNLSTVKTRAHRARVAVRETLRQSLAA